MCPSPLHCVMYSAAFIRKLTQPHISRAQAQQKPCKIISSLNPRDTKTICRFHWQNYFSGQNKWVLLTHLFKKASVHVAVASSLPLSVISSLHSLQCTVNCYVINLLGNSVLLCLICGFVETYPHNFCLQGSLARSSSSCDSPCLSSHQLSAWPSSPHSIIRSEAIWLLLSFLCSPPRLPISLAELNSAVLFQGVARNGAKKAFSHIFSPISSDQTAGVVPMPSTA